jgi:hypothetical protein
MRCRVWWWLDSWWGSMRWWIEVHKIQPYLRKARYRGNRLK